MNKQERVEEWEEKIKKIISNYNNLNEKCSAAEDAGTLDIEGNLFNSIWSTFDAMLEIIDPHDWISWYIFDNDCGASKMEAGHGDVLNEITTPRKLAELIVEAEDRYNQNKTIDTTPDIKKAAGLRKTQLVLMPPVAEDLICQVLQSGAEKYGAWNWRLSGIETSTYISAIKRHLAAIHAGEWIDPESDKPHIAHIAAGACIMMDSDSLGGLKRIVVEPEILNPRP